MAKYLHRYKSREDFEKDYYGSGPVTAFTVTGGIVSPGCGNGNWTETHDFDGKYVFVEETTLTTTSLCDGSVWTDQVRIFKKGDVALYDTYNNVQEKWGSELGYANYVQDPSQASQAGDAQLDVSNLEYGEPVYHEPWVSCTTATEAMDFVNYNKKSGNKVVLDFTRSEDDQVVSWTDDFVPNSEGAVYEIYGTDGQTHTLVVGETPEGWIGPFAGAWWYDEYGEILQPDDRGSCEVAGFGGTYYVECHQK